MIGGRIIEIAHIRPGIARLWCIDGGDECAVNVKVSAPMPAPGDSCWWQSGKVYCRNDTITLVKVGFSYDPRPALDAITQRNGGKT